MEILCRAPSLSLEIKCGAGLMGWRHKIVVAPPAASICAGDTHMQDFLWIGLILCLLAATLGYAALCARA
jgi:hypothetical protein